MRNLPFNKVDQAISEVDPLGRIRRNILRNLSAIAVLLLFSGCCHSTPPVKMNEQASPNQSLLDELDSARAWVHAKKTRPIWARLIESDRTVESLEGRVSAKAGDYLCRGEAGELWPQSAKTLAARYAPTDAVSADGWRKYRPHPDAEGVMAAQVQHAFAVVATWGKLSGKPGDYVLKNFRDRLVAYPEDVWVVDQALFRATYEVVKP